jgi:Spy/CpxP family protein refolding chaperone
MKSVKMLLSVLALSATVFVSTASAQEKGKGRGQMSPEQQITRIEEAVGSLSAEQKTKITAIYGKLATALQAIPQDERREKGGELMMASRKEVRAVLTAEQQAKFDAMPQGGRGGDKGGGKKKN